MVLDVERNKKSKSRRTGEINTTPLYIMLLAAVVLYIIFQRTTLLADIFGLSAFVLIIITVIFEFSESIRKEGLKRNVIEIAIVIIAIMALWVVARSLLNSSNPIDVVPSCSMLPYLSRGDIIILHGIKDPTTIKAPTVEVNPAAFNTMMSNISSEFLECVAFENTNGTVRISQEVLPGYSIGLYSPMGSGSIVPYQKQSNNLIKYTCGTRQERQHNGTLINISYTTSITIGNATLSGDRNNSIVVYSTVPSDVFYKEGDAYIVHRAYAVMNVSGSYYVLTKGDNNPGLDLQYGNYPASFNALQGEVVASIPYLGYIKLILSNDFGQPQGCAAAIVH